jgi:hypothetical protein
MPKSSRSGSSKAAIGAAGEPAVTRAPEGGAATESRWLIQPVCSSGRPVKSALSPSTCTSVLPNSETPVRSTDPPSSWAISCIP